MSTKPKPSEYDGPDTHLTADDYQKALYTQGACNASGLVFSLAKVMDRLCEEAQARGKGTDWRNHHPIVYLYVAQIADLSGVAFVVADFSDYGWASAYCEARAKAEPMPVPQDGIADGGEEYTDEEMAHMTGGTAA